jgi:hypothetical protein
MFARNVGSAGHCAAFFGAAADALCATAGRFIGSDINGTKNNPIAGLPG